MRLIISVFLLSMLVRCCRGVELPVVYVLREEQPNGTYVGNLRTDVGLSSKYNEEQLAAMTFSVLRHGPHVDDFTVNSTSGVMKTSKRLDRDRICPGRESCVVTLDVAARSSKVSHITKVSVELKDINDNAPKFPQSYYAHQISEATRPGLLFFVPLARDDDSPQNGIAGYQLVDPDEAFDLVTRRDGSGGADGEHWILRLELRRSLDRERQDFYRIKVVASDRGEPPLSGTAVLEIDVTDANDNVPVFTNSTYHVEISENSPPQRSLLVVRATDADKGPNGALTYELSERTRAAAYGSFFAISPVGGVVSLLKSIDYEKMRAGRDITLEVVAKDGGDGAVSATARVVVTVRDINDNSPVLNVEVDVAADEATAASGSAAVDVEDTSGRSTSYVLVHITENCLVDTFIAHLSVSDADRGGVGRVECSLLGANPFRLEEMYENEYKILTSGTIDRESADEYHLTTICNDLGQPTQPVQSSSVVVHVVIEDVNDNAPRFSRESFNFEVFENNKPDIVIGKVDASDRDKASFDKRFP